MKEDPRCSQHDHSTSGPKYAQRERRVHIFPNNLSKFQSMCIDETTQEHLRARNQFNFNRNCQVGSLCVVLTLLPVIDCFYQSSLASMLPANPRSQTSESVHWSNSENSSDITAANSNWKQISESGWTGFAVQPSQSRQEPKRLPKPKPGRVQPASDSAQESYSIGILIKPTKFVDATKSIANESRKDYQIFLAEDSRNWPQVSNKTDQIGPEQPEWQATDLSQVIQVGADKRNYGRTENSDSGSSGFGKSAENVRDREHRGDWKKAKNGHQIESTSEKSNAKDASKWLKNMGHNKHGWRNIYHREEYADHRKFHDVLLDKNWAKHRGVNGSNYDSNNGVQYDENQSGSYYDKDKHATKFDYQKGDGWKRANEEDTSKHYDEEASADGDHQSQQSRDEQQAEGDKYPGSAASRMRNSTLVGEESDSLKTVSMPGQPTTVADESWESASGAPTDDGDEESVDDEREIEQMKARLERGSNGWQGDIRSANSGDNDWSGPRKSHRGSNYKEPANSSNMPSPKNALMEDKQEPDVYWANQTEAQSTKSRKWNESSSGARRRRQHENDVLNKRPQARDKSGQPKGVARQKYSISGNDPFHTNSYEIMSPGSELDANADADATNSLSSGKFSYNQIINSRRQKEPTNISDVIPSPKRNNKPQANGNGNGNGSGSGNGNRDERGSGNFIYNRNVSAESRKPAHQPQPQWQTETSLRLDRVFPASSRANRFAAFKQSRARYREASFEHGDKLALHPTEASPTMHWPVSSQLVDEQFEAPNDELLLLSASGRPNNMLTQSESTSLTPSDLILLESAEATSNIAYNSNEPAWQTSVGPAPVSLFPSAPPLINALNEHLQLAMRRRPRLHYPNQPRPTYNRIVASLLRAASLNPSHNQYPSLYGQYAASYMNGRQHAQPPGQHELIQAEPSELVGSISGDGAGPMIQHTSWTRGVAVPSQPARTVQSAWMTGPSVDFDFISQAASNSHAVFKHPPVEPKIVQFNGFGLSPMGAGGQLAANHNQNAAKSKHSARFLAGSRRRDNKAKDNKPGAKPKPNEDRHRHKSQTKLTGAKPNPTAASNLIRRAKNVTANFLVFG